MNFASDNAYGAHPDILAALTEAAAGAVPSYGDDEITARVTKRLAQIFDHEIAVYPVVTGTAANSLALATLCPPHGAVFCHAESHIATDECAAPEFFSHGAKLVGLEGARGKLTPDLIQAALPGFWRGVHSPKPSVVSITQLTELGTAYTPDEAKALADFAHSWNMTLHMDGARFANALVHLGCAPADLTWRAGVDALSFGATKNGALCAEAVIFFDKAKAADFEYRRKKSGHLLSKMRFVSAQLDAYLAGDLWLKNARRANALAQQLAGALRTAKGVTITHPVDGNQVFAELPVELSDRLRAAGAHYYDWAPAKDGRVLVRLVTSFITPEDDVAAFAKLARG
ncbi:MAG: low specificity L-threonine aldolase [Alphaproteobacteria bacterium]|nr:low specificity L-threonine aldolase [Alphaproteobacteria bacterium]MDE2075073.1 low specificity L-threonine aldolase [Alphaproteobacteria bacterium]